MTNPGGPSTSGEALPFQADGPGVHIGQEERFFGDPFHNVRLEDNAPLYWALLKNQAGLDNGPGVIDRSDAKNAQDLLRMAVDLNKDKVLECQGKTRVAARAVLLGILAREKAN